MAYDLRFLPEYCCGVAIGTASPTISETYALGSIKYGNDYVTLNTDKKKYEFYAARPLTWVNLTVQPFASASTHGMGDSHNGSLWIRVGNKVANVWTSKNIQWRVSTDNYNWSSWYSASVTATSGTVKYFNFWWSESNVFYVQMRSSSSTAWSTNYDAREYCTVFTGDSNYRIALEGNLNSMATTSNMTTSNTMVVHAFHFREFFSGQESASLMYTHNLVHNASSNDGRQCYAYMLRTQVNLLTAPLYWNAYSNSTAYSTSYNQLFRGFCDGCTSLLTGLRNYKGWSGDCAYLYRNCTNLRFIFKCFGASSSNMVQNVPTAEQWNSSPAKYRVVQTVSMGSGSASYPTMSNWTAYVATQYWGSNRSDNTNRCLLPANAVPVAIGY